MGFTGSSGSPPPSLRNAASLSPPSRRSTPEGGSPRDGGKCPSEIVAIGFTTALLTFTAMLAHHGSSSRTLTPAARECGCKRLRDPPDLRCRLSRHLPVRRPSRFPDWTTSPGIVQRSPLRRMATPESAPSRPLRDRLRDGAARRPSAFRPRGFSPPRRFSPPMPCACCNALPTVGFTPFRNRRRKSPCCADPSLGCSPCPPKPSLRPKLRARPLLLHANVDSMRRTRGTASPACCHAVHRHPCLLTLSFPSTRRVAAVACACVPCRDP